MRARVLVGREVGTNARRQPSSNGWSFFSRGSLRFSRVIQFDSLSPFVCVFFSFFLSVFSSGAVYCARMFFDSGVYCVGRLMFRANVKFYILLNNRKIQQNIAVELM